MSTEPNRRGARVGRILNATSYASPRLAGRYAFPLFIRTGPRTPVRPAERPVHDQAVLDHLVVEGKQLAVYRWGNGGRRVLLMHGFGGRASNLAAFAAGLAGLGMTAVAFDSFGHGDSEGDRATIVDITAAVRAVAGVHGPFHAIIAHSFGGLCAYHAVRTTVSVARLVTIAAVCEFGYLPGWFSAQLGLRPAVTGDLRRRSEEFFRPETDIWQRYSATFRADEWAIPLLVVHDRDDKEVAVDQGRKIADAYRKAEYVETVGLGHRRILGDAGVVSVALGFVAE